MIPLMFLLGQQNSGSGDGSGQVTPPGTVPSTCVSGCTTPLPEIRNSSGDIVNIGDFWTEQGGYYSGLFTLTGNEVYALIISPASFGQINNVLHGISINNYQILSNMLNMIDGKKNTEDSIDWVYANNQQNNYPLMKMVKEKRDLNYSGFSDWYIPSREETILLMKHFKPNNMCSKSSSSSCNGQTVNTKNLFPCNVCNLSTLSQTTFNIFKETQVESLQPAASSNPYLLFLTSSGNGVNTLGFVYFQYKGTTTSETNQIRSGYSFLSSEYITSARLVRRVLVS